MTQTQKTQIAFDIIAKMMKEKSKYLVRIAMQYPKRDDLKTIFRQLDDGK